MTPQRIRLPATAEAYIELREQLTGNRVHLSRKQLLMFSSLDRRLLENHIGSEDYILVTCEHWYDYAYSLNVDFPLPEMLCSDKAFNSYLDTLPQDTQEVEEAAILYLETAIIEHTINKALYGDSWIDNVNELAEFINNEALIICDMEWSELCTRNEEYRLFIQKQLTQKYSKKYYVHTSDDCSYEQLAELIRRSITKHE